MTRSTSYTFFYQQSQNDNLLTRALTHRYIIAFSLMAIMVTMAWFTMTIIVSKENSIALIVNISGRQRMLSQQTALLSLQLVQSSSEQRPSLRQKLRKSVKLMMNSHLALTHGNTDMRLSADMSSQIRSMYFESPLALDTQVRNYLSIIQELLEAPDETMPSKYPLVLNTLSLPLDRLLESLDKVVKQYQIEGELIISRIQKTANYIWISSLILLILEAIFIFYPTIVKIRNFIRLRDQAESQHIAAREEAEHANLAKSQFLSAMSHELHTPMNAIIGFTQLLQMDETDPQKKHNLQDIMDAGEHLLHLINELLDLSKIESGGVELTFEDFPLEQLLHESLSMIQPLADKRAIRIDMKCNSSPTIIIKVDRFRFKQVLINILSNAVKYNRDDGIVTIDCSVTDKNMLYLTVADTGEGMTKEQQSVLFNPYERLDADTSHIEGTGLGLVIAKELIENMNGEIVVDSKLGQGTSFSMYFPLS